MNEADNKKVLSAGLSGSTLKIIAVVIMMIDHFGLAIWWRLPDMRYLVPQVCTREEWLFIYRCFRNIGRTAFPIFCFLLVEGLLHTSDKKKYAVRLFVFALISEIPYHYAFLGLMSTRNVFFTLFFGLLVIWGIREAENRLREASMSEVLKFILNAFAALVFFGLGSLAAEVLDVDYGWKGIMLIWIFYVLRANKLLVLATGYLSFIWEAYCLPAFILLGFYNGKRGIRLKLFFYLIYPVHLAVYYIIWNYIL